MATPDTASSRDPADDVPAVPISLQHCPTLAGRVIPWISARTSTRVLFGAIDQQRATTALRQRLCGVCGQALHDRLVLLMRLSDLPRHRTNEPPLHPWCAAYSTTACPMLAGQMRRYRSSGPALAASMLPASDTAARRGAPAEPWFAVWLSAYDLAADGENLVAVFTPDQVLRIRPITWRLR